MLETVWKYATHQQVDRLLVDGDDCILVGKASRLAVLEASTGKERWSVGLKSNKGWLAATRESVFYLNRHSNLVAHDRATGRLRWTRELPGIDGWLHAYGNTVIAGGWCGFSDLFAINATDGTVRWSYPATEKVFRSVRIYTAADAVLLADPINGGRLIFLDLEHGHQVVTIDMPGTWTANVVDWRVQSTISPAVLDCGQHEFAVVEGRKPALRRVVVSSPIMSESLVRVDDRVVFRTTDGEMLAWPLADGAPISFGRIPHNVSNYIPFCRLSDELFAIGTCFGQLMLFRPTGERVMSRKVGKRVSTPLHMAGSTLVFGTASGVVIGMKLQG
jgi:hypothetical protein